MIQKVCSKMYVVAKIGKWMNIDGHGPCIVRWLAYDSHGDDQTRIHRVVTCSSDGWFRHSVLVGLGYHKTKYQDLQTIDHSYVNKLPEGISYVCMYIYIYIDLGKLQYTSPTWFSVSPFLVQIIVFVSLPGGSEVLDCGCDVDCP